MRHGLVFWFTGLSGAGKTTTALMAERTLLAQGLSVLVLDGDEVRNAISRDLGFDRAGIRENNRRVAAYCSDRRNGVDAILVPIISPFREDRAMVRSMLEPGFYEVWISAPISEVIKRDPKGLYSQARAGKIANMIGYSPGHPYEEPTGSDLEIQTADSPPEDSARQLVEFIISRCPFPREPSDSYLC
jgi:adenylyl-sulfate kinase